MPAHAAASQIFVISLTQCLKRRGGMSSRALIIFLFPASSSTREYGSNRADRPTDRGPEFDICERTPLAALSRSLLATNEQTQYVEREQCSGRRRKRRSHRPADRPTARVYNLGEWVAR